MSLIQEALRRQQEDMDDHSGATPPPAEPLVPAPSPQEAPTIAKKTPIHAVPPDLDTSAPPPVQEPPAMGSEEEPPPPPPEAMDDAESDAEPAAAPAKEKPGMKVALLAIGAVACLGLSVWAVTFAVKLLMTPSSVVEEQVETPAEPDAEPTDVAEVPVVVGDEPETATPVTPEPVVVEAPPPIMEKEPVIWPILVLNGLVGKGAQGAIMVNNQIIGVGEAIEDVRVVSISKQGAMLEHQGEKKFVKVGGSTE
jgi:hypothetical protein